MFQREDGYFQARSSVSQPCEGSDPGVHDQGECHHDPLHHYQHVQVPERQMVAAASEEYSCEFGSSKYFALCAFGGVLSCGITHTAVTPLDLVKCRLQVHRGIMPSK